MSFNLSPMDCGSKASFVFLMSESSNYTIFIIGCSCHVFSGERAAKKVSQHQLPHFSFEKCSENLHSSGKPFQIISVKDAPTNPTNSSFWRWQFSCAKKLTPTSATRSVSAGDALRTTPPATSSAQCSELHERASKDGRERRLHHPASTNSCARTSGTSCKSAPTRNMSTVAWAATESKSNTLKKVLSHLGQLCWADHQMFQVVRKDGERFISLCYLDQLTQKSQRDLWFVHSIHYDHLRLVEFGRLCPCVLTSIACSFQFEGGTGNNRCHLMLLQFATCVPKFNRKYNLTFVIRQNAKNTSCSSVHHRTSYIITVYASNTS